MSNPKGSRKKKEILNRELSWLSFNHRVLQEAKDPAVPLIERLRFLGIFSNNRDEFFKVRVASLHRIIDYKLSAKKLIGGNPEKILQKIMETVIDQQNEFNHIFREILQGLQKEDVYLLDEKQLNEEQKAFVNAFYQKELQPVITPIMLKQVQHFPLLKDKNIYLAVRLTGDRNREFAIIEIPTKTHSRFLFVPTTDGKKYIILLEDLIRFKLPEIFDIFHFNQHEGFVFKITRDAELDIDNDLTKSFLERIDHGAKARSRGEPIRFVYDSTMPRDMIRYLTGKLDLDERDHVLPGERYHNFKDFMGFPNPGGPHLEFPKMKPLIHPRLKDIPNGILDEIEKGDFILQYPYHDFNQFINLLREAAMDPKVYAIKITIYRLARVSKVVNALTTAALNGKEVTAVFELQARFDEEANIYWSKKLEAVGAKVVFGIPGLKIHAKLCLISRRINRKINHYVCVSTGNFHEGNAAVYTDTTLFTCDPRITTDARKVFDFIDNTYRPVNYNHFIVSPVFSRMQFSELIETEIQNARDGKEAYIILKLNNLVDRNIIHKLYEASNAGVKQKHLIRGICSLIPGVEGMSENIEVRSIVGRFLEHTRILIFCNGGEEKFYITSADWMTRNLDHRVEATSPIYDKKVQQELRALIDLQWQDNTKARIIDRQQSNQYVTNELDHQLNSQLTYYEYLRMEGSHD